MYEIFDTHAHLLDEAFDADCTALLEALPAAGITRVMEACCTKADMPRIRALCNAYPFVYGSAGIHPENALEWDAQAAAMLEEALADPHILAVGEIGLDYHWDDPERPIQRQAFADQVAIANAHSLPVLVHDRDAHGDCVDILRANRNGLKGIMHCFSGSYETARECMDLGLHIAFGGALTFKSAHNRREIAAKLPLDRLLVETDCPYMAPEPYRGQRNDPRGTRRVVEVLASIRPESEETIAAALYENALRLFGLTP